MTNVNTIQSEKELREYLSYLIDILGWGFHPDTPIADYIRIEDNAPSFPQSDVPALEKLMNEAFDFCETNGLDIYDISYYICTEIYGDIFEKLNMLNTCESNN